MQSLHLRNDTLLEIATFLVRRWSEKQKVTVGIVDQQEIQTKLKENKVIMFPLDHFYGTDFQKYRQFRTALWYESMRLKHSNKILSNDHAFGFLLNTLETKRIEKIKKAAEIANAAVKQAVDNNFGTDWLEKKVSVIIKILEIDPLLTIPISIPKISSGIAVSDNDFIKTIGKITKFHESDFGELDPKRIVEGKSIFEEFKVLLQETKKNENRGVSTESIGISIPSSTNVDETRIYDEDLISNLKAKFKEWKTGWREQHVNTGEEFDEETYMEGSHKPFFTDQKISIKTRIVILLDHSSSIANEELQYKKATLALCEVLSFLKVKFSVYAFNTEQKQVTCWLVKPENIKWNNLAAKRLAQIKANGGTPLAEVYSIMFSGLRSKKPDIFLTLTDGEPSDPDAVRSMVTTFKLLGISMVAIGVGPDTASATIIANNLKRLGYENTLAVSRLNDIPNRVLNV